MLPKNLAFVDIETTGISPTRDRVIEIAILRVENGKLVHTFESLINPQAHVSPYIQSITGINPYELESAPLFETISADIEEALRECIFVAHNVRFDYSFIQSEFARMEKKFSMQKFCTVKLSRSLFPRFKHHDLDSVTKRFNIEIESRHRAMGDAKAIWQFFDMVKSSIDEKKFTRALDFSLKRPSAPPAISEKILNDLPETPGVYIFSNEVGTVIYVGKSINIRDRVLSHFAQNTLSTDFQICQQTHHIEAIQTKSELGALIKEANLVKTLNPVYNRQLRRKRLITAIFKTVNESGYETVQIENVNKLTHEDTNRVLGIFKSKRQAINFLRRVTKEHSLCPKILGLETRQLAGCMHYQFGWCFGACKDLEMPLKYNLRFLNAFYKSRIDPWPYGGPIAIKDHDLTSDEEIFVINNWCLENQDFDYDIYKILRRYLRKNSSFQKISAVPNDASLP